MTGRSSVNEFRLEFRRIQSLSSKGNQRIRIAGGGDLYAEIVVVDLPPGQDWPRAWPGRPLRCLSADELQALRRLVADTGFADLPAQIVQAGHDGFRDELEVTFDGRVHTVIVERAEPPAPFARIRKAVWKLAGPPFWS